MTKGSTSTCSPMSLLPWLFLQWLFLHPLLALGRRAPTPAKPASKGHCCLSWGTHHLPIPSTSDPVSTSDVLRVLSTTSLTLLCHPWWGCLVSKHSHKTPSWASFFLQAGKLLHGAGEGQGLH